MSHVHQPPGTDPNKKGWLAVRRLALAAILILAVLIFQDPLYSLLSR